MSIVARLTSLFRPAQAAPPTTADAVPPSRPSAALRLLSVEGDRRTIVADARRMVRDDPRAEAVLDSVSRDLTRGGFSVSIPQQANAGAARRVAADLIARLRLTSRLHAIVRETLRDGDGFYELAVSADGLIQDLSRKPTLEMRRLSDETDRFADPTRAYCWSDEIFLSLGLPPRDAVYFADWQMIHLRWAHDEQERYGRPMLASGRTAWLYAAEGERDTAVRRKTRSSMRYVHELEGASEGDIEAYRARNRTALEDPNVAVADFFTNKVGGIAAVQGDAHLSEIGDVEHHISTAFFNSPIPLFLLGYGEQLNRDVLEQQQAQYDRTLDGMAQWLDEQFLIPLLERQWLLAGLYPRAIKYEIVRPSRTPITAALLKDAADAATALRGAKLPDRIVLELLGKLIPGLDVERVIALRDEERAANPPPPPPPQPAEPAVPPTTERRNGTLAVYARG